ncbi:DUF4253 domain-containing protein [Neobacillus sp. D3-1R]|uniref:DUF4253 domain-containing protein n=1 Tax=Neobacillus sp. D3-1R TaxID=3445778 RepID=UPI003FA172C6
MGIFDKFRKRKKDVIKEIADHLSFEYEILEVKNIQDTMNSYQQALHQGKQEGFTPIFIVPSELMVEIFNKDEKEYPEDHPETILTKAKDIDETALFKRMLADVMPDEDDDEEDMVGEFTVSEQLNNFRSLEDFVNQKLILAKVPTDKPWEAAAWIPMGGFNECPLPEEQVAVFKYWYDKYGAIPALVTHDVWELYVEHPPTTQEESEALAWEQFGFCPDIVYQGVGTVKELAGTLIHSRVWFFWWD